MTLVPAFCDFSQLCLGLDFPWLPCSFNGGVLVKFKNNFCFIYNLHAFFTAWEKTKYKFPCLQFHNRVKNIFISSQFSCSTAESETLLQTFVCSIVENHEQKPQLWSGKVWAGIKATHNYLHDIPAPQMLLVLFFLLFLSSICHRSRKCSSWITVEDNMRTAYY